MYNCVTYEAASTDGAQLCSYIPYIIYICNLLTRMKKVADDPNGVYDIATANCSKNRYHNIHTCKFKCAHFRLF